MSADLTDTRPWMCRLGWHDFQIVYPTDAEFDEIARLSAVSKSRLIIKDSGYDRVCLVCNTVDDRLQRFIQAIRVIRGEG